MSNGGSDHIVRFDGVQKSYDGEILVVKNLNLDVDRGEFLTMLGPSGSGKTTVLMMLAGFETATHGEIYLNDTPINNVPPHKRGIGMVFQNYALFPAHDGGGKPGLPASGAQEIQGRDRREGAARARHGAPIGSSATGARPSSPAASSSASRSPARWCSSPIWC